MFCSARAVRLCYSCYSRATAAAAAGKGLVTMAERLAHRDLRNRSAEILREVAAGGTYEITNHGEVVAILSPPDAGVGLRVRPARLRGGFTSLTQVVREASTQDVLDDLRSER